MDYPKISDFFLALPFLSRKEEVAIWHKKNSLKKNIKELEKSISINNGNVLLREEIARLKAEYKELADDFLRHHLRLPYYFIKGFHIPESEFADYIAEGNAALYRAFNGWNPEIAKFSTYAGKVIKSIYFTLNRKRNYRDGRARFVSLEKESEERGLIGCLKSNDGDVSLGLANEDRNNILYEALKSLGDRERVIIEKRYGLNGYEKFTLEQVGKIIGVTKERVRQIQFKAIEKIKKYITNRYGDDVALI